MTATVGVVGLGRRARPRRAPLVIDPVGPVWSDIALMQKDLGLALDAARQLGVPLPTTAATNDLLTVARSLGYERRDIAGIADGR